VIAAYVLAGRIGHSLAFKHEGATVWPPTGIALAALLLLGYRAWPAIFAGAFLVHAGSAGTVATSLAIATGNTAEGLIGASLVNRWAKGRRACDRAEDVVAFALLAGLVSTAVSSTVGVTTLTAAGFVSLHRFWPRWLAWWLGNVAGTLVLTPPLLLWGNSPRLGYGRRKAREALLLLLATGVLGALVFGGFFALPIARLPVTFLCLPLVVWAAHFGPREIATVVLLLSFFSIRGALTALGPFADGTPDDALLVVQAFMGVVSMTGLLLAVLFQECRISRQALSAARDELEQRVRARTEELATALRAKEVLLKEIHHRVKNNLQIAASLLNLQSDRLRAPGSLESRAALLESRDRIHAMALVHEALFKTDDVAHVDMGAYVRALVADLSRSFAGSPAYVALRVRVGDLRLDPDDAVQYGLILNELVSNSLKHAFPEGKQGSIVIELHPDDRGNNVLVVSDDGVGFPEGLDFGRSDTLGLTLLNVMVAQLRGTIERPLGPGTTFRMTFPARRSP
jgi:two-component sensor histidine kinase/integral membrane sensor domain MASE1